MIGRTEKRIIYELNRHYSLTTAAYLHLTVTRTSFATLPAMFSAVHKYLPPSDGFRLRIECLMLPFALPNTTVSVSFCFVILTFGNGNPVAVQDISNCPPCVPFAWLFRIWKSTFGSPVRKQKGKK